MEIERILENPFNTAIVIISVSSMVFIILLGKSFVNRGVKMSVSSDVPSVPSKCSFLSFFQSFLSFFFLFFYFTPCLTHFASFTDLVGVLFVHIS